MKKNLYYIKNISDFNEVLRSEMSNWEAKSDLDYGRLFRGILMNYTSASFGYPYLLGPKVMEKIMIELKSEVSPEDFMETEQAFSLLNSKLSHFDKIEENEWMVAFGFITKKYGIELVTYFGQRKPFRISKSVVEVIAPNKSLPAEYFSFIR